MGLKGVVGGRGGADGLWEMGQLILSMGPEWRDVRAPALKATTQNKGFLNVETSHIKYFTLCIIV
jgi:hypothetical protein